MTLIYGVYYSIWEAYRKLESNSRYDAAASSTVLSEEGKIVITCSTSGPGGRGAGVIVGVEEGEASGVVIGVAAGVIKGEGALDEVVVED